jgi:hypothetical protein
MNLFCFASRNVENIRIGIEHHMWAVATLLNQQSMAARITKAEKYLKPGNLGVLYCNPTHSFTTPFIVRSHADPDTVVTDVWPAPWRLPFKIETLGNLSRQITGDLAAKHWPVLKQRLEANHGRGGVSAAFNITGTTVFVPVEISGEDWEAILEDLATKNAR